MADTIFLNIGQFQDSIIAYTNIFSTQKNRLLIFIYACDSWGQCIRSSFTTSSPNMVNFTVPYFSVDSVWRDISIVVRMSLYVND